MATRFYLKNDTNTLTGTFPTSEQGAGTADVTWTSANTLRTMNTTIGTFQTNATGVNASTSQQRHFIRMFASPLIAAQTIAAQTWTFFCGDQEANAAANYWTNIVNVYVWRPSSGTKVGTIIDGSNGAAMGGSESTTTETVTTWTFSGSAVTAQDGDVIICEVWAVNTASMSTAYTLTVWYHGTVDTGAEDSAIADAASFVETANDVTFYTAPTIVSNWQPEYPDIARGRSPLATAQQQPFADPDILPEPYLYTWWKPSYPDRIPAAQRLVTGAQLAYSGPQRQPDPPSYAWDGDFPDRVWPRRGLHASQQQATARPHGEPPPDNTADVGWLAHYPDRLYRRTFDTTGQLAYAAPVRQPDPPARSWSAVYVDSTRGPLRLVTGAQSAHHAPTRQPEPPPSWRGTWPDRIDPKRGLPAPLQQSHTAPTRQPEPPPLAWEARYPSKIDPRRGLWSAQQRAYTSPERQPDPPARAWCGVFPDRVPGVRRLVTSAQMAHAMPGRQPEPVFFRGGYPDAITRHTMIVAQQRAWFGLHSIPLVPPPDLWCTSYPDFARRRVGLIVASQRAHFFPEIKADAWTPAPPDTDPTWTPDAIDGSQVWTADAVDTSQTWTPDDVDDAQIWTPDTVDPSQDWTPDDS